MLGVLPSHQGKINRLKTKSRLGVVVGKGEEGFSNKRLRRIRTAVLLPGSSAAGVARGENLADSLASRGFAIRTVKQHESLVQYIENILPATTTAASSVVVFDVDGRSGRDMAASCKSDARIAGLYSFRPATGMFRKVNVEQRFCNMCIKQNILTNFHPSDCVRVDAQKVNMQ